jgi:type IV pilus assembly protein PilA
MYFALMGKLSARRQNLAQDKDKGFTLIELLVVVIIIGILAAIAIPVYLGVQSSSKDASVKSDLTNAKTAIIASQTDSPTNAFPANADLTVTALGKYGFTQTNTDSPIAYKGAAAPTSATGGFCIQAKKQSDQTKFFSVTDAGGVKDGACA